ncbi:MAG: class E sortase [Actinobacteria bacterium]|nr:class E sortase [Actinomycetota bacterium]
MPENIERKIDLETPKVRGGQLVLISALIAALIASGYASYELLWTNYVADKKASVVRTEILKSWSPTNKKLVVAKRPGKGFALLYIPRLKNKVWSLPILEGVEAQQIDSGVGHYSLSAMPGQIGNFAIAGHRATYGEPFANFDRLKVNDNVIVRTKNQWFTYTLDQNRLVKPTETWVVNYPLKPPLDSLINSQKLISLVTCDPRWGSVRRWVWWGHMIKTTNVPSTKFKSSSVQ